MIPFCLGKKYNKHEKLSLRTWICCHTKAKLYYHTKSNALLDPSPNLLSTPPLSPPCRVRAEKPRYESCSNEKVIESETNWIRELRMPDGITYWDWDSGPIFTMHDWSNGYFKTIFEPKIWKVGWQKRRHK